MVESAQTREHVNHAEPRAPAVPTVVPASLLPLLLRTPAPRPAMPYDPNPSNIPTPPANDPVAQFQKRLDAGQAKLDFNDKNGYLASLLQQLNVPASSQTLVFSKTSFQRDHISPATPRALYFDDDTYVGWVRGGDVLEL